MVQLIKNFPHETQGPIYVQNLDSLATDDLATQGARASKPWYWPSSPRIFWPQHQKIELIGPWEVWINLDK